MHTFILFLTLLFLSFFQSQAQSLNTLQKQIALTFDDLPAAYSDGKNVIPKLISTLQKHQVPGIGFVNEAKLYEDGKEVSARTQLLKDWLKAGFDLGNHSFSHVYINQVSVDEYKQEVIKGEKITKRILSETGKKIKYYRHTQLRTGPTKAYKLDLEKFLKQQGYTIAPVTIDNDEYVFARIYARAKESKDTSTMNRVVEQYIPYMESIIDFYERLSNEFLGYQLKQILLLHANELNADHGDKLIAMMKKRKYNFISLDEALQDKAYQLPDAQCKKGYSWIQRWMLAKGTPVKEQPQLPPYISELFKQYAIN